MSRLPPTLALALLLVSSVSPVWAQRINVDFGAGSIPTDGYAAVGDAGYWNLIGVLPPFMRVPLVDVTGTPVAARIYMYGGTQLLEADDPATIGDDAALMDDMLIGMNDPVDVCVWIDNLIEDDYEVLIFALTPNEPSRMCNVRVDDGTPGPADVGGAWPGTHQRGVSYERFTVHATGGLIAFHSGIYNGFIQSGINGVQIRALPATSVGTQGGGSTKFRIVPNPSHGNEPVEFGMSSTMPLGRLELFDTGGRLLWVETLGEGRSLRWDGRDLGGQAPRGVLFARWSDLATGSARITEKIVRLP